VLAQVPDAGKVWTHAAYLVIDDAEASTLKIGAARLSRSRLHVELMPGLCVLGRLVFELMETGG
jgi:hypothetical protein